jgi:hypothetical protein
MWEPFKDLATACTAIGNKDLNCQQRTQLCQQPFTYFRQLLAMALEAVVNGAMNFKD